MFQVELNREAATNESRNSEFSPLRACLTFALVWPETLMHSRQAGTKFDESAQESPRVHERLKSYLLSFSFGSALSARADIFAAVIEIYFTRDF